MVYARYRDLWAECGRKRRMAADAGIAPRPRAPAAALDPFALFSGYPSATLSAGTRLALRPAASNWETRLASPLFDFAMRLAPEGVAAARAIMRSLPTERRDTLDETASRTGLPLDAVLFGAGLLAKMGVAVAVDDPADP